MSGISTEVAARLQAAGLDPAEVVALVRAALAEDLPSGVDVTTVATVPAELVGSALFVPRAAGVVAGLPLAAAAVELAAATPSPAPATPAPSPAAAPAPPPAPAPGSGVAPVRVSFLAADGQEARPGAPVLRVEGPVRTLLTAERTALNLLTHTSGVATLTRAFADALRGTGTTVLDTRKTLPGLRAVEKYAVRCGGGANKRLSLSDAALVKDNHVLAAGGVAAAFRAVRSAFPDLEVQVECDTVEQVAEALQAGARFLLCDNMDLPELAASVRLARGQAEVEATGGVTLDRVAAIAATGVDYVSVGALTASAPSLDIGVDLVLGAASC